MSTKVLYSAENTSGVYLETLLGDILEDLNFKTKNIEHLTDPVSKNFVRSNKQLIHLIARAKKIQESAIMFFELNTELKPYTTAQFEVLAHPLTYGEFVGDKLKSDEDPNREGYFVVRDQGTGAHHQFWLPKACFESNYRKL